MKVLLDIKDSKSAALIDILSELPYVKINTLTETKAEILQSIKRAAEELILVKKGKLKAKNAKDFLNEFS